MSISRIARERQTGRSFCRNNQCFRKAKQSSRVFVSIETVRIAGVKILKNGGDVDVPEADYSRLLAGCVIPK
jgi:hypothetical protein